MGEVSRGTRGEVRRKEVREEGEVSEEGEVRG